MFLVSSFTNFSNRTRIAPVDTNFDSVQSQSDHTDRSNSTTSSTRSIVHAPDLSSTNSSTTALSSKSSPSGSGTRINFPVRVPISKKKSTRRKKSKAQCSGYHPRCLPRSIDENKKLSYHLRIEKILYDQSLQLFRTWLLCEVCNIQSNSENQLKLHFNSKNHKLSVWKLTPKHCVPCGVFGRFQTSQLWDDLSSRKHQKRVGPKSPAEHGFSK